MALDHLKTPEPHYIPGYTGYCPQYVYRMGETFGSLTHKILLDPTTHKSSQLVLSDRSLADFQIPRKIEGNPDLVESMEPIQNSMYKQYIPSGYTGSMPKSRCANGKTFSMTAHDGMTELEKQKELDEEAQRKKKMYLSYIKGDYEPSYEEKMHMETRYKLPLVEVRPEYRNILQDKTMTGQPDSSLDGNEEESQCLKHYATPEKGFKSGYTGHIPFSNTKFGAGYAPLTMNSLCDFTTYYHRRKSTEWAPINIVQAEPPMVISSNEIYHKHMGMVPNYTGHIPGHVFRSGKTFGADSRDAKRWLRGDYS